MSDIPYMPWYAQERLGEVMAGGWDAIERSAHWTLLTLAWIAGGRLRFEAGKLARQCGMELRVFERAWETISTAWHEHEDGTISHAETAVAYDRAAKNREARRLAADRTNDRRRQRAIADRIAHRDGDRDGDRTSLLRADPRTGQDRSGQERRGQARARRGSDSSETLPRSEPAPVFVFDVVGKGPKTWGLPKAKHDELIEAFPGVDVAAEYRKAAAWLGANPKRRKTAAGMPKFLYGWCERSQNRGRSASNGNGHSTEPKEDRPVPRLRPMQDVLAPIGSASEARAQATAQRAKRSTTEAGTVAPGGNQKTIPTITDGAALAGPTLAPAAAVRR